MHTEQAEYWRGKNDCSKARSRKLQSASLGRFPLLGRASAEFTGESKRQRCSYPGLKPNGVGGKSHAGFSVLWIISVSGEAQAQSTVWTLQRSPGFGGNVSFKSKRLLCKCKLGVRVQEEVMSGGYGSFIPQGKTLPRINGFNKVTMFTFPLLQQNTEHLHERSSRLNKLYLVKYLTVKAWGCSWA